jgi:hypothetical protein
VLLASPAAAQALGGAQGPDISVIRVVAALIISLSAALALALWLRGRSLGGARPMANPFANLFQRRASRIRVIEARRIGQYAEVSLIECDEDEYLILSSANAQQVLRTGRAAVSPDDEDASSDATR